MTVNAVIKVNGPLGLKNGTKSSEGETIILGRENDPVNGLRYSQSGHLDPEPEPTPEPEPAPEQ